MIKKRSPFLSLVYALLFAVIASVIFSSLFGWFYLLIFKPVLTGGLDGIGDFAPLLILQNSIFAYLFFLPLSVMLFIRSKQWLVWLIFIFLPFTMVLVGGWKYVLWFIIFTIVGGFLGWLINQGLEILKRR